MGLPHKTFKLIVPVAVLMIVGCLAIFPSRARAESFEEFELKNLGSDKEKCEDQNTCLGMCSCELEVSPGVLSRKFIWTAYKPHDDRLFRISGQTGPINTAYHIEGNFKFNSTECRINFDQNSNEQFAIRVTKTACNYQPAFCCCIPDPKTGLLSDCQRQVNHTDPAAKAPNFSPTCGQIIGGKHQPYIGIGDELNNGQCQLFQDTYNNKKNSEQQAKESAQQGVNVKFESRKLNELSVSTLPQLIGKVIQLLLGFVGSILFGFYFYAGLLWMTARGESDKVEHAKKIMFWATAGVAMMLASYIIVSNLFNLITK